MSSVVLDAVLARPPASSEPESGLFKRITISSVPFLFLHSSLRTPISAARNIDRLYTELGSSDRTFARVALRVASLGAVILKYRALLAVTTVRDVLLNTQDLYDKSTSYTDIAKYLLKMVSNLVEFGISLQGGLGVLVAWFTLQAMITALESGQQFSKNRWIEGGAKSLMSMIRSEQVYSRLSKTFQQGDYS